MNAKTSKTRLVADRLAFVNQRIGELTAELDLLTQEKGKLDVTLEVLASIGNIPELPTVIPVVKTVIVNPDEPTEDSVKRRVRRQRKIGVTERVTEMLKISETGMKYLEIVDEMSKYGEVNRASLTATLSRMVRYKKLVRIDDVYLLND